MQLCATRKHYLGVLGEWPKLGSQGLSTQQVTAQQTRVWLYSTLRCCAETHQVDTATAHKVLGLSLSWSSVKPHSGLSLCWSSVKPHSGNFTALQQGPHRMLLHRKLVQSFQAIKDSRATKSHMQNYFQIYSTAICSHFVLHSSLPALNNFLRENTVHSKELKLWVPVKLLLLKSWTCEYIFQTFQL